jgi:hypothetical protein
MKVPRRAIAAILVCASISAAAAPDSQKAWDRMKSLVGGWEGKTADGKSVSATYQLTAGGTALMQESSEDHMVTMFYVEGDRLLLTHYCGIGNQPRMQATISPDGKLIDFQFLDGTNIPTAETGHMHRAVYTLADADHYTEEWTWKQAGKETKQRVEMQRKK